MKKENRFVFYLLSFTWGLLWTLIGLLTALVVIIIFRKDVYVRRYKGRIRIHLWRDCGFGISMGVVVITAGRLILSKVVKHELGHTIQAARFGLLFIPLIAIPSGIRYQYRTRTKRPLTVPYNAIWFEGQATRLGDKYF